MHLSFLHGMKTDILGRIQSSCPPGLGPAWRKLHTSLWACILAPVRWAPIACSPPQLQAQLSSQGRKDLRAHSHGWELLLACLHISPMLGCTATDCWRTGAVIPPVMDSVRWAGDAGRSKLQDNLSNQSSDLQAFVKTKGTTRY